MMPRVLANASSRNRTNAPTELSVETRRDSTSGNDTYDRLTRVGLSGPSAMVRRGARTDRRAPHHHGCVFGGVYPADWRADATTAPLARAHRWERTEGTISNHCRA